MVRREIYRHQWTGTAVLQPELCHSGPIHAESAAWQPAHCPSRAGGMAGEAGGSGAGCWSRETGKAGPAGVREYQHVHRIGWADRHCSLPPQARPLRWQRICISGQHRHDAEIHRMGWAEFFAGETAGAEWNIPLANRTARERSGSKREGICIFVEQINRAIQG